MHIRVPHGGKIDDSPIIVGMHQSSPTSPNLFNLILDVLTKYIPNLTLRCVFFVCADERLETSFKNACLSPKYN